MASNNIQQEGMLPVGTTLQGGKYRIERVLGQGGFGITYLAKYTSNGRKVAIKELFVNQEGLAINDRNGSEVVVTSSMNQELFNALRAKFKKEALRLTHFVHPNLVKVNDFFEENGTAYYTMQYIEGESLKKKLNREGAMSETLVLDYARQVLSALEVVHREKIWHLDIKPDNIMVDGNDNVYLIDFGASKHIEKSGILTTSLDLTYTPAYCAPEMKDLSMVTPEERSEALKEIGAWTDLYSLGATMYNLLTESIPPSSVRINKVGRNAYKFPSGVSSSTKNLILKMMNPNKEDRPRNALEVVSLMTDNEGTIVDPRNGTGEVGHRKTKQELEREANEYYKQHDIEILNKYGFFEQKRKRQRSTIWMSTLVVWCILFICAFILIEAEGWAHDSP
ncbi:MAG: serine/threonine protein kinase, partial [Bacteroidaceae bacterium]|nr:serine/threonine protein kinase [Bacteroidaceae bacterium]